MNIRGFVPPKAANRSTHIERFLEDMSITFTVSFGVTGSYPSQFCQFLQSEGAVLGHSGVPYQNCCTIRQQVISTIHYILSGMKMTD